MDDLLREFLSETSEPASAAVPGRTASAADHRSAARPAPAAAVPASAPTGLLQLVQAGPVPDARAA